MSDIAHDIVSSRERFWIYFLSTICQSLALGTTQFRLHQVFCVVVMFNPKEVKVTEIIIQKIILKK